MPITNSFMAAINAALTAQTTALTTAVNAARDNVKADNTTQITSQNTALTTTINAARDNVKADNVTQVTAQTTAINNNTNTKTGEVTTAVNAKGVVKSVQRGVVSPNNNGAGQQSVSLVTIASVNIAKSVVIVGATHAISEAISTRGNLNSATQLSVTCFYPVSGGVSDVNWQVIEYF